MIMKTKKLLAAALVMVLAMGLSVTAFAETLNVPGSKSFDVNGSYKGTAKDVYSVDIEWGSMNFTYETTGEKEWNPETHEYNVSEGDTWKFDEHANEVKVTNHSNKPVSVEFSFAKEADKGNYEGALSVTGSKQLAAGVEHKPQEADNVTCALTFTGTLNYVEQQSTKLGEITVTLNTVTP